MSAGNLPLNERSRRVIRELDARYVIPKGIDPIRVLTVLQVANNDGGTGSHNVYVCLCDEVDDDA